MSHDALSAFLSARGRIITFFPVFSLSSVETSVGSKSKIVSPVREGTSVPEEEESMMGLFSLLASIDGLETGVRGATTFFLKRFADEEARGLLDGLTVSRSVSLSSTGLSSPMSDFIRSPLSWYTRLV